MATMTASGTPALSRSEVRRVIFASSLGTVFEWYDFYLYGSLAAIIAKQFFAGGEHTHGRGRRRCAGCGSGHRQAQCDTTFTPRPVH